MAESFQCAGPRQFNSLPIEIRNLTGCSVDQFKFQLDTYLENIPDLPHVPGGPVPTPMDPLTAVHSNSITNWAQYLNISNRRPVLPIIMC